MMGLSSNVISLLSKREAQEQGGLLNGQDPAAFNVSDPLRLWIIQVGLIIGTAQILSLALRKLRQPRVIAEVLGGILLGPTAFGRIPGFTAHIFPKDSIPYLSLVANIGLVLFLFLVGLEVETAVIKRNARFSLPIALGGMVLPFGFGAALAVPLYHRFIDPSTQFTHFMLFTGVAYSITAFPVLCRILTELKLIDTTVGIVVLSAGVGNDIIGWTLLALSVALVNAGSGLTALWILLIAVGWTLFLLFPVKRLLLWLARRTGSIQNGPTMFFMTVTIILTFGSAFFTDVIGVHAIFGGFLAGLIVPREGGLAITLTEKLEDMVSIIFLPLYFTLSGLSTNLGLLDDGITWGYTVAILALAYIGKFGGCTIAARFVKFSWRESSAIGTLMSCKGLVELIVLNVGLNAGILTPRVFAMFVLEALVLTFMTTPVVLLLYPPSVRTRVSSHGEHAAIADKSPEGGKKLFGKDKKEGSSDSSLNDDAKTHFTIVLDQLEHLPGMMTLTQLIHPPPSYAEIQAAASPAGDHDLPLESSTTTSAGSNFSAGSSDGRQRFTDFEIDALRLIELSDRTSAVMRSSAADELIATDPLLAVYKTFGELNDLPITTSLSIVPFDDLAASVADRARENGSDLVLLPWLPPSISLSAPNANGTMSPSSHPATPAAATGGFHNPFDALFKTHPADRSASLVHSHFIRGVFKQSATDVALYVDRFDDRRGGGDAARAGRGRQHLFLPFFGGPDDRLALAFVVQLCANPRVTATVIRITKAETAYADEPLDRPDAAHVREEREKEAEGAAANIKASGLALTTLTGHPDTIYGNVSTHIMMQSETADNIAWSRYASSSSSSSSSSNARLADALTRITFAEASSPSPLHTVIDQATVHVAASARAGRKLTVVLGRSRRLAVENHQRELKAVVEEYHQHHGGVGGEVKKTIGDVATALVASGCKLALVVMQAADRPVG